MFQYDSHCAQKELPMKTLFSKVGVKELQWPALNLTKPLPDHTNALNEQISKIYWKAIPKESRLLAKGGLNLERDAQAMMVRYFWLTRKVLQRVLVIQPLIAYAMIKWYFHQSGINRSFLL